MVLDHNNLYVIPATDCTSPAQPTSCIDSVQHRTEQWRRQQAAPPLYNLQTLTELMNARNSAYITGTKILPIYCQKELRR